MNIERERAAFEWWASDEGESSRATERVDGCYKLAQIQSYWMAWQARADLAGLIHDDKARSSGMTELELLRAAIRHLCNTYAVDDYYEGQLREERLEAAVNRAIDAVMEAAKWSNPPTERECGHE